MFNYETGATTDGRWKITARMRCDHCDTEVSHGVVTRLAAPTTQDAAQAAALEARGKAQVAASVRHGTHSPVVDARGGTTCPACTAAGHGPRDWFQDGLRGVRRDRNGRGYVHRERAGSPHGWHGAAPIPDVREAPPVRSAPRAPAVVIKLRPLTGAADDAETVEVIETPESHEPIVVGEMGRNAEPCIVARRTPDGAWSVAMLLSVDGLMYATSQRVDSRADAQAVADEWTRAAPQAVACVREGMQYFPREAQSYIAECARRAAQARAVAS